ncbi:MAG: TauD/TfdA family dioxygenase [Novosphingobium sp.]|jgi:taurine dioxygenase|nr:TauD/TfdA family dioxygenase [Novosphingobium sp.]
MKFDLSPYRHITLRPVTGALGAEVTDIDCTGALAESTGEELRRALGQFHVLFFRDQQLDDDGLLRLAEVFGPPATSPLNGPESARQPISRLVREADAPAAERNFGDRWHMDRGGDPTPPLGFLLCCEEAPEYGGDTLFASLSAAYDALPDHVRQRLAGLTGVHSMSRLFGLDERSARTQSLLDEPSRPAPFTEQKHFDYVRSEAEHPLVCRHPLNGRPYLFVTGSYFLRVKGLPQAESDALVDALNHHVTRPDFTCRFRWRKDSIAILDNRCTLHFAANDYAGFARRMRRIELGSDWVPQ